MITEDYVSFETAKLLKEKGFPQDPYTCNTVYTPKGKLSNNAKSFWNPFAFTILGREYYMASTLQMAMKWLREVHNLHCCIEYDFDLGWYCQITSLKETAEYDYKEMKHYHPDKDNSFSSSEEACEAAIKYCLEKLI